MDPRRTKIVATIGPASDDPAVLLQLIDAGMDMARLGLAHGPVEETIERIARIRAAARRAKRHVGILVDLPGPKVRAGSFPEAGVVVAEGDVVELVADERPDATSNATCISVTYAALLDDIGPGDRIPLGDGGVELRIERVEHDRATAVVASGGLLKGRPGVTLASEKVGLPTPTPDDLRLLGAVLEVGVDAVAISFVRQAADVARARAFIGEDGPTLVAKIETQSAVDAIDEVIAASDAVMVARGDLGVRCALEDVPHIQKHIIRSGVAYGRPVITATQMLESMVYAPKPTRAEVTDVANAVFDGTSALMLSGETAIGLNPVAAVATMARIAVRAERDFDHESWGTRLGREQATDPALETATRMHAAISAAAWRAAIEADVKAILCCTRSGATARSIARFRPRAPILGVTPSATTARQMGLMWGVEPVLTGEHASADEIVWFAVEAAVNVGVAVAGDVVAVLAGAPYGPEAATDILRLVRVH